MAMNHLVKDCSSAKGNTVGAALSRGDEPQVEGNGEDRSSNVVKQGSSAGKSNGRKAGDA